MTVKPLHVAVAAALGWEYVPQRENTLEGGLWIAPNRDRGENPPRYDTDWAATGPLIERFGLTVAPHDLQPWVAFDGPGINAAGFTTYARTPLLAVCHLILALKEAGKL